MSLGQIAVGTGLLYWKGIGLHDIYSVAIIAIGAGLGGARWYVNRKEERILNELYQPVHEHHGRTQSLQRGLKILETFEEELLPADSEGDASENTDDALQENQ